jgi:hypothetical protein
MLCLSQSDSCLAESGGEVQPRSCDGRHSLDVDEKDQGVRDDLIATGIVEQAPNWLQCRRSRRVLMIDEHGVRHDQICDVSPNHAAAADGGMSLRFPSTRLVVAVDELESLGVL